VAVYLAKLRKNPHIRDSITICQSKEGKFMADFKIRPNTGVQGRTAVQIDEGLRSYMLRVYNLMGLGVALTALITLYMAGNPALMMTIAMGPMKWVLFVGVLGLGWFAPRLIMGGNSAVAHAAYWGYAALWGLLISPMVAAYMGIDGGKLIIQALAITSVTFGSASLFGYVTKRDMTGLSGFFMMASIGILVAILLNVFFFQSTMMSLFTSIGVVLLFSGITAYETQMIKNMYSHNDGNQIAKGKAIFGAFMLYGSFVTLFIHILNILGIMDGD
jgi:FtsH-binding integral membrane protein